MASGSLKVDLVAVGLCCQAFMRTRLKTEYQLLFDDAWEERLNLFHRRLHASTVRREASEPRVADADSLAHAKCLPRLEIEFRLEATDGYVPGRWTTTAGLGKSFENYVAHLCEMERLLFENSSFEDPTANLQSAFSAVMNAANALADLGWPVDWEQNVQKVLG